MEFQRFRGQTMGLSLFQPSLKILQKIGPSVIKLAAPDLLKVMGKWKGVPKQLKKQLSKSKNPYLALLAYRTTLLVNGEVPCQLLMSRMLWSTIPVHPMRLNPKYKVPDSV